jgi:hypothetical protein
MRLNWEPLVWRLYPVRSPNPANFFCELSLPLDVPNMFNRRVAEYDVEALIGERQSAAVGDDVFAIPGNVQFGIEVAQSQPATDATYSPAIIGAPDIQDRGLPGRAKCAVEEIHALRMKPPRSKIYKSRESISL